MALRVWYPRSVAACFEVEAGKQNSSWRLASLLGSVWTCAYPRGGDESVEALAPASLQACLQSEERCSAAALLDYTSGSETGLTRLR